MSRPRWLQLPFPFDRADGPEPEIDRLIGVVPPAAVSVLLLEIITYGVRVTAEVHPAAPLAVVAVGLPILAQAARRIREVWRHAHARPGRLVPHAAGVCETCDTIVPVYEDTHGAYVCGADPRHGLLLADWTETIAPDWLRTEETDGLAH